MAKSPVVCLFLIITLFGCVALAQTYSAINVALPEQSADQRRIITEVRHELRMLSQYSLFNWIEFEVMPDNSVVLRGQVLRPILKADAEAAVKNVDGISGVVNQIETLPPSPSDDQIRRNVYRAIYADDGILFRYAIEVVPTIHIIVKNGNVTLKGVVDTKEDSDFANVKANGVSQVFSVKNELRVEKP
jgi:hyperosmotically inducible periplasmic protein